ncbi:DUF2061 domain-containing protein [Seleniivibrio woodruffii]|uniref:Putative membrane protein n=1 Tax=Seleniivibrio woodruffii TaxID=1078050 RepID=A0A4R1KCB6_9BACT|nr:DUF2061 domain-containing protein [Seleniivibrio woodruffii]TCK61680.1 putative membrane protein [Seleniivibrio woodruffii]TVZ35205.1 adenylylsulfate kinase [Seleniivibrio woodruffii]
MFKETTTRSVLKAVSWRFFGTMTTMIIVYVMFRRIDLAVFTGILETLSKIALYFVHERIWNKIPIGKNNE